MIREKNYVLIDKPKSSYACSHRLNTIDLFKFLNHFEAFEWNNNIPNTGMFEKKSIDANIERLRSYIKSYENGDYKDLFRGKNDDFVKAAFWYLLKSTPSCSNGNFRFFKFKRSLKP